MLFDSDFYDFAKFYEYVHTLPGFVEFKKNHSKYEIDKDILGLGWVKGGLKIVTCSENMKHSTVMDRAHKAVSKQVKFTDSDGLVTIYDSTRDCERRLGTTHALVSNHCNGVYSNPVTVGKFKGCSFEYV